jgi:spore coat polysaccharide biosynthesis predicted glycosyltransferase SpsG
MSHIDFIIEFDANEKSGSGHLIRAIALYKVAQEKGLSPAFYAEDQTSIDNLNIKLKSPTIVTKKTGAQYYIRDCSTPADPNDFRELKSSGAKIILIDELEHARKFSDQVFVGAMPRSLVDNYVHSETTSYHYGLDFIVLNADLVDKKTPRTQPRNTNSQKLLICMGGSDPKKVGFRMLSALLKIKSDLHITLLAPGQEFQKIQMLKSISGANNIKIVTKKSAIRPLLESTSLLITKLGLLTFEALYLGVPCSMFQTEQLHLDFSLGLVGDHTEWPVIEYGLVGKDFPLDALQNIIKTLEDPEMLAFRSKVGQSLVDGRGAERIITEIIK